MFLLSQMWTISSFILRRQLRSHQSWSPCHSLPHTHRLLNKHKLYGPSFLDTFDSRSEVSLHRISPFEDVLDLWRTDSVEEYSPQYSADSNVLRNQKVSRCLSEEATAYLLRIPKENIANNNRKRNRDTVTMERAEVPPQRANGCPQSAWRCQREDTQ